MHVCAIAIFRSNQVSPAEKLITMVNKQTNKSMLALLKEGPGKKFHEFQSWRTFLENLRTTTDKQDESLLENSQRIITRKLAANYHAQHIVAQKFMGLKQYASRKCGEILPKCRFMRIFLKKP